jgi:hypothetical protein
MSEVWNQHGGIRQEEMNLEKQKRTLPACKMDQSGDTLWKCILPYLDRGRKLEHDVRELQTEFDDWLMNPNLDAMNIDMEAKLMCNLMRVASDLATVQRILGNILDRDKVSRHSALFKHGPLKESGEEDKMDERHALPN